MNVPKIWTTATRMHTVLTVWGVSVVIASLATLGMVWHVLQYSKKTPVVR